ncbi:putative replication protein, partial [Zea mays]
MRRVMQFHSTHSRYVESDQATIPYSTFLRRLPLLTDNIADRRCVVRLRLLKKLARMQPHRLFNDRMSSCLKRPTKIAHTMVAHQTSADIVALFSGFKNGSKALLQLRSAGLCTTCVAEEGITDAIGKGLTSADSVGGRVIVPVSFTGGRRDTGPTVDVVLWGERATAFPAEQVHRYSGSSPQIIIFVGTLVRSYADNVSLSGGSSCKWYINAPVPEVNALRASAESTHRPVIWDQGKVATESTIVAVPEHKKLKDIKYLHPFENKKKEWLVIVKVLKIDRSWWYNACKKCLRTTKPHGDTYKCTNNSCDTIGSPTPRSALISGQGSGVTQNKGAAFIHEPSLTPESRKVSSSAKTTPHQGDNLLLGKEIIPAPPNVETPSGAHNTPGANTLRLLPLKLASSQDDTYSVLDGSTNKIDKSVTGKRSRTSPSKKAAKKLFRDEVITNDDAAGSTDVDAEKVVLSYNAVTPSPIPPVVAGILVQ